MNYYKAVEKKAEHGGGWAFMQLNRRSGAAIACGCSWETPGHPTAEEAERCFYDHEKAKGVHWVTFADAYRCVICEAWTPENLEARSNLLTRSECVCAFHFENADEAAAEWLWERHPFTPGIQITASW